jgi:hypothetical protein
VASGPSAACSTSRHPDQPPSVRARSHTVPTAAFSGHENPTNLAFPTLTGADCTAGPAATVGATALGAAAPGAACTDPVRAWPYPPPPRAGPHPGG